MSRNSLKINKGNLNRKTLSRLQSQTTFQFRNKQKLNSAKNKISFGVLGKFQTRIESKKQIAKRRHRRRVLFEIQIPAQLAVAKAVTETLSKGLSVTYSENGKLLTKSPEGTVTVIGKSPPKIRIRQTFYKLSASAFSKV